LSKKITLDNFFLLFDVIEDKITEADFAAKLRSFLGAGIEKSVISAFVRDFSK